MRKIFITLFIIACFCYNCFADAPPCWCNFERTSGNGKYTAKVYHDSTNIDEHKPISEGWTLTVYDNLSNKPVWTIDYDYSGYPDGYVADNGKSFVYVEYWYDEQSPLIKIYTNGQKLNTNELTGSFFKIDKVKLKETISHRLWLYEEGAFAILKSDKQDYIEIKTIDNQKYKFDLSTGRKL